MRIICDFLDTRSDLTHSRTVVVSHEVAVKLLIFYVVVHKVTALAFLVLILRCYLSCGDLLLVVALPLLLPCLARLPHALDRRR